MSSDVAVAVAAAALCRDLVTTEDMLLWLLPLLMKEEELLKDFANSLSLSGIGGLTPSYLT